MEQQENRVVLRGTVAEEATLSHQVHGIAFYRFPLAVPRLSGREDRLNILCPHTAPEDPLPQAGAFVEVRGEVRSFNNRSGVGNRLVITVLARELLPSAEEPCNQVVLGGVLCKPPVLRRTPWGGISVTCSWRSTAATAGRTISPASPGAGWPCSAAACKPEIPFG